MKNLISSCFLLFLFAFSFAQTHQHRITLNPSLRPFYHGVESGDPTPDNVIIWTRVTPDTGMAGDMDVFWQVATDVNFINVINFGTCIATDSNHYCVKADVCGLQPSTYYYYMFNAIGRNSVIGRTKTAPAFSTDNDSARFAVVSCASWEHGFFNAYESISNRNDVDAVLHLGDYIYEYAAGDFTGNVAGRDYDPPTEAITEVGYELRYSQYKLDDQLRRIHQLFPFITIWDDHETANDSWRGGAQNHTPATEGDFNWRKGNSTSTYFKWMPLRKPDLNDTIRIFRRLRYGKLLDLIMLDTRLYDRDEQNLSATNDPTRHMMGPAERAWFFQQLDDTTTRWKIIGNQVMFAPLEVFGQPVNADQWDGYNYERGLIEDHIMNNNVKDVVILTGDIHTSWCNDVPGANYNSNTGAGAVCVEFVGSSVTSANSPLPVGANIIKTFNPHMKYINLSDKGYYILDVKKNKAQADYTYMSTVSQLGATDVDGPHYFVNDNERHLNLANTAISSPTITAANPPLLPNQSLPFYKITDNYITIPENTAASVNLIPNIATCPSTNANITQGNHGYTLSINGHDFTYNPQNNYHGYDTVMFTFCTTDTIPVCDTVYFFVTITSVQDIDTVTVLLDRDSSHTACLQFDDLASSPLTINSTQSPNSSIVITDTCFTYTPNTGYSGTDVITFTTCDAANNCDTIVYIFAVDRPVSSSVVNIQLNKNSNYLYCTTFDDLVCAPSTVVANITPHHGTYQWLGGDSCVHYYPYFNYVGDDTMRLIGCDTCGLHHCDTITLIFHVVEPNAVAEEVQNNLILFGMYPNPVGDKLGIQYFLYDAEEMEVVVYDMAGKQLSAQKISNSSTGLHYFQLNTSQLPKGVYIVELKSKQASYRKRIAKE